MRPSIKEVLAGMHYTMQQEVIPELSSPNAALQARGVARLLKYMMDGWDGFQPSLEEENHRARQLLKKVSIFLAKEPTRVGPEPVHEDLAAAQEYPRGRTLESLNEENLRLRAGLCRALELLRSPGPTHRKAENLKKAILRLAGGSVDGEMEAIRKKNE